MAGFWQIRPQSKTDGSFSLVGLFKKRQFWYSLHGGVAPALRPCLIGWRLPGPDCTSKPLRRAHCSCNYDQFAFPWFTIFSKSYIYVVYVWDWELYVSEGDIFGKGTLCLCNFEQFLHFLDSQYSSQCEEEWDFRQEAKTLEIIVYNWNGP